MTHGTPDWGVTAGAVTTYQLTDLAELAARLGSIDTFDRRGDILYLDSFEDGLVRSKISLSGTGAAVDLTTLDARHGLYAARLVAGSDVARLARIQYLMPYPALSRLGAEVSFRRWSAVDSVFLDIQVFDGQNVVHAGLRWRDTDDDLQYYASDGSWTTFQTGVLLISVQTLFHVFKLVVDASAAQYVRAIVNETEYDLSGIAARVEANATEPNWLTQITNYGLAGSNSEIRVDDLILTQNEPAQP